MTNILIITKRAEPVINEIIIALNSEVQYLNYHLLSFGDKIYRTIHRSTLLSITKFVFVAYATSKASLGIAIFVLYYVSDTRPHSNTTNDFI